MTGRDVTGGSRRGFRENGRPVPILCVREGFPRGVEHRRYLVTLHELPDDPMVVPADSVDDAHAAAWSFAKGETRRKRLRTGAAIVRWTP